MMEPDGQLQQEVDRLRAEVEQYRQRELADLKSALSLARDEVAHYKIEAQRNADVGRQIAGMYETKLADLRAKLEALTVSETSARRFGPVARN